MAFTPGNNHGVSNSTTAVTVVAAPGASQQRILKTMTVHNNDTVSAIVTVMVNFGGTKRVVDRQTIATRVTMKVTDPIVLDAVNESIEIILDAVITTNQLDFVASYADLS